MNLPETIWNRLKIWATSRASVDTLPSLDDCKRQVESIAIDLSGRRESLPPQVITFYANETLDMIERLIVELDRRAE